MRGILYYGPNNLKFSDKIENPKINNPNEVIIKVAYCGICGTDLLSYKKGSSFFNAIDPQKGHPLSGKFLPQIMGHEISGTVVEVGEKVTDYKVGDKVVVEPTCYCEDKPRFQKEYEEFANYCSSCKDDLTNLCEEMGITGLGCQDGGLAEYMVTAEHHLVKIPDWIPLDVAALVQPLAVCFHAIRIAKFKKDSTVLVVGGGSIGIGCILAAKAYGARSIVCSEPAKIRREHAAGLGAQVFNPSEFKDKADQIANLKKLSEDGKGFDYAFDCSGFPITFHTALGCLKTRGTMVNVAIWTPKPMDFYPMDITGSEKTITGSMCYTIEDFKAVMDALEHKKVSVDLFYKLITKKVELEDAIEGGFEELYHNKDKHIKILITPKKLENGKEVESN